MVSPGEDVKIWEDETDETKLEPDKASEDRGAGSEGQLFGIRQVGHTMRGARTIPRDVQPHGRGPQEPEEMCEVPGGGCRGWSGTSTRRVEWGPPWATQNPAGPDADAHRGRRAEER